MIYFNTLLRNATSYSPSFLTFLPVTKFWLNSRQCLLIGGQSEVEIGGIFYRSGVSLIGEFSMI